MKKADRHPIKILVGKNLAQIRDTAGISQDDLAIKLGISKSSVSRIETGHNFLSPETLLKASDVLGVPPSEFFRSEGERAQFRPSSELKNAVAILNRELLGVVPGPVADDAGREINEILSDLTPDGRLAIVGVMKRWMLHRKAKAKGSRSA